MNKISEVSMPSGHLGHILAVLQLARDRANKLVTELSETNDRVLGGGNKSSVGEVVKPPQPPYEGMLGCISQELDNLHLQLTMLEEEVSRTQNI